jgi:hypothetical protein
LENKQKAIICDLDGTLFNIDHRLHYVKQPKKDWKNFNSEIPNDTPNKWCLEIIKYFGLDYKIIFVSGRSEDCRLETLNSLNKHTRDILPPTVDDYEGYDTIFLTMVYLLLMRKAKDYRPDEIVKKEIYEKYIKEKYDVLFVIDDRKRVVDMWRKEGLVVLHCAEGNF